MVRIRGWRMRETPEGKFQHEKTMYFDRCLRIHDFRKPTIAAVQGSCVAAGLMLAAMCDLIVAADDAVFSNPVLRLTGAGVELLVEPWELGIRKAKEFLFTGDTIDAQEAWRLGWSTGSSRVTSWRPDARAGRPGGAGPARHRPDREGHAEPHRDLMGKRDALKYHFMAHHWVHNTATALDALAARKAKGSMKEVVAERDKGHPEPKT